MGRLWSARELARLETLRDGQRLPWKRIVEAFEKRSVGACMLAYYNLKARHRRAQARSRAEAFATRPKIKPAVRYVAPAAPVATPRVQPPASAGVMPTSRLVVDAELRARIAERGLTGGVFGDPAPGRSALDQKRSGAA